jgi:SAM-dependent methyltransferase
MANLFDSSEMAAGYAKSRPAVHPLIIARAREHLRVEGRLACGLDVGCGAGLSTRALQAIAGRVVGIDPFEAMVRWGAVVAPGAGFAVARAEALPVRSGSVDVVAAAGSLNYADLDLFFPEAARVLAPGGVLVVYDFSEGRRFRGSPALDGWYAEFLRRYPKPVGSAREITPETLACAPGFRVSASERFEVGLAIDPAFYLDYVMTETNVAEAVRGGAEPAAIRTWCGQTLAPVFGGVPREVLFRGYIAYLRPTL